MSTGLDAAKPRLAIGEPAARAAPFLLCIIVLTALRSVMAAHLPISFDEAYFWLWSKHLQLSYFEHPPLIALAIRAGTEFLGDTSLGVRLMSLIASVAGSWAVWRAAALVLGDPRRAWLACLFFNLTLMVAAQGMAGTPDIFVMAAAAFLLWSIAELQATHDGRWWLLAGLSLGVALLAKYTAFFLGGSLCLWVTFSPDGRRWLRSPWPYAAAALAGGFLLPNLVWNQTHGWISFHYQFGRVVAGTVSPQHLLEFVAGQLALASPFVMALAAIGLIHHTRSWSKSQLTMVVALVWPAAVYFLLHSLHDRVQGNWPSFIYPGLAILAASVIPPDAHETSVVGWIGRLAIPTGVCLLAVCYLQALTGLLPVGKADPIARMTAVGFEPVAADISLMAKSDHAAGLLTTRYVNTGWLAFYARPSLPVMQAAEEYRWTDSPAASDDLLERPLLYVTQRPDRELAFVKRHFSRIVFEACVPRLWSGVLLDSFCVYRIGGFRRVATGGRIPIAYQPTLRVTPASR